MTIPILPGVFDIVPKDSNELWRSSYLWDYVISHCKELAKLYGFREISTPIIERAELFQRGVGTGTDIVSKEMYLFKDRGDRLIALRPEGTASVMRAFIEKQLHNEAPVHKFFYIAPMFRYERQQAGRYRQHHQFGIEIVGPASPLQDAEMIDLAVSLFKRLGLRNLHVNINSLGTAACRMAYRQQLVEYLQRFAHSLSEESQKRLSINPLRILDSKDAKDIEIVAGAPLLADYLSAESKQHFEEVLQALNSLGISYEVNQKLVRGLDYYNKTVFEVVSGDLGAQNSVCGGGRYDGLMKTLGGPDLPTLGFGCGLERLLQTIIKQNVEIPMPPAPALYIIAAGKENLGCCFSLAHNLRRAGVAVEIDYSNKKIGKAMQLANASLARFACVIGDNERASNQIAVKEMATGQERILPLNDFVNSFKQIDSI